MAELNIGLVLPDVLGTYGDDGNALVLRQRARLRGITAEIHTIRYGEAVPDTLDIYTLGGGEDVDQLLAAEHLGGLIRAAEAGRPVFAICAGLQVLGESFHAGGKLARGLELVDATTSQLAERMIGELNSQPFDPARAGEAAGAAEAAAGAGEGTAGAGNPGAESAGARALAAGLQELTEPLTGFANRVGATVLGPGARALGILHPRGGMVGNTDEHGAEAAGVLEKDREKQRSYEGAVQGSVIATYMHGPALARNPQLADVLLARAMGTTVAELPELGAGSIATLEGAGEDDGREFAEQLSAEVAQLRKERLG